LLLALSTLLAQNNAGGLEGSLVHFGTNVPIENGEVVARSIGEAKAGQQAEIRSRTNARGHFSIQGLRPGRYTVSPYFSGESGMIASWITIHAGEQIRDFRLALTLDGTIHGRVLQSEGTNVRGLRVELFKAITRNGETFREFAGRTETDARGEYLFKVRPGEYYVRAQFETTDNKRTYFPGTLDPGKATPVDVSEGSDSIADFQLSSSSVFKISGKLVGNITDRGEHYLSAFYLIDRNSPVRELTYLPLGCSCPADHSELEPLDFLELSKDEFEIRGVRPGSYDLIAVMLVGNVKPGSGLINLADISKYYSATYEGLKSVEIGGSNLADIRVDVRRRTDIEVKMSSNASINLWDRNGRSRVTLQKDGKGGSFFGDVPLGDYRLQSFDSPEFYLSDIRQGGMSIYQSGLKVTGSPVEPLEVLISREVGTVSGVVEDGSAATFFVVLIPEAPQKRPRATNFPNAFEEGFKFEFRGVAPGEYRMLAFDNLTSRGDYEELLSDAFLGRYASQGVPVTVTPGRTVSVKLRRAKV
jgi:hypothetical protein